MTTTDAAIMDTTNKTITKTIVPVVERPLVELSFVGLVTTIVAFWTDISENPALWNKPLSIPAWIKWDRLYGRSC